MNEIKIKTTKSKIEITNNDAHPFKLVEDLDFDLNTAKLLIVIVDEVERQIKENNH